MYYSWMVQPKTPPLSVRLGEVRLAGVDAYALKHGLKRHAAVLELIDLGLHGVVHVAIGRPTPKPIPGSDAAARKAADMGATPEQVMKAAKPVAKAAAVKSPANPARLSINVPVATNAPAPYGSLAKKGLKK